MNDTSAPDLILDAGGKWLQRKGIVRESHDSARGQRLGVSGSTAVAGYAVGET